MKCNAKTTGERIAILRKEIGLKQVELAKRLNVSRQIISYYETGVRLPNTEDIAALAEILGTTSDYLIGLTNVDSTDVELKAVCEYTGLNEHSVCALHDLSQEATGYEIDFLNAVFRYEALPLHVIGMSLLDNIVCYKRNLVSGNKELIELKGKLKDFIVKQIENKIEPESIVTFLGNFVDRTTELSRNCRMYRYDCIESFSNVLDFYVCDNEEEFMKNFSDCKDEFEKFME